MQKPRRCSYLLEDGERNEDAVPDDEENRGERLSSAREVGETGHERQKRYGPEDGGARPGAGRGIRGSHKARSVGKSKKGVKLRHFPALGRTRLRGDVPQDLVERALSPSPLGRHLGLPQRIEALPAAPTLRPL